MHCIAFALFLSHSSYLLIKTDCYNVSPYEFLSHYPLAIPFSMHHFFNFNWWTVWSVEVSINVVKLQQHKKIFSLKKRKCICITHTNTLNHLWYHLILFNLQIHQGFKHLNEKSSFLFLQRVFPQKDLVKFKFTF